MGTKRIGLARVEALMENLKRELSLSGSTLTAAHLTAITRLVGSASATTTAAAAPGVALTESLVHLVDSTNNTHRVKMFAPSAAGQICIIFNVDDAQDVVVRNSAGDAMVPALTLGEGKGAILISKGTAATDWVQLALTA